MVEVDPITLLAAGTVVVGILTLVSCFRTEKPNPKPTIVTENTVPAPVASKPKRKSKSKSKSKAAKVNSESNKPLNNGSSSEFEAVPSAALAANVVEDEEDKADEDFTEDIFVVGEASKRAKKSKETPEQKATRLERQKVTKSPKKVEDDILFSEASNSAPSTRVSDISAANASSFDGWAVVEKKNAKAKKSESASDLEDIPSLMTNVPLSTPAPVEEEIVTPPAPVDLVTKELTVEAKKLGLLIGPKGITKIGMQTATGTEISMPKVEKDHTGPVTVAVTGSAEGVDRAVYALNELCQKGYCNLLASPDFHEGYVEVKPKFLPDIIGKSGFCIRAIQQHTGVKISTPSEYTRVLPSGETVVPSKVKIILAGTRDKVSQARSLILDLTKYYYTPVTHPGLTHVEMDIPSHYYNYIIGAKGSEIKHIQANYKVTVHIPNADSVNPNLLIVGELSAVQNAEKHIQRLMEKVDERAKAEAEGIALGESAKAKFAAAAAAAGTTSGSGKEPRSSSRGNRTQRADRDATGGSVPEAARKGPSDPNGELKEDEEWTSEYAPRRSPINLGAMLPATAKFAAAAIPSIPASPSEPSAL